MLVDSRLAVIEPLPPGSARSRLREATAKDHAAVDAIYSGFDLSRAADYRAFLMAHHDCLAAAEEGIAAAGAAALLPDWPARRRAPLLAADLEALGVPVGGAPGLGLAFSSPTAALGAVYVLEGSRFGGALLARRLPPGSPARFLGAGPDGRRWRGLVAILDDRLAAEAEMGAAVAAARSVFDAFARAGRRWGGARG